MFEDTKSFSVVHEQASILPIIHNYYLTCCMSAITQPKIVYAVTLMCISDTMLYLTCYTSDKYYNDTIMISWTYQPFISDDTSMNIMDGTVMIFVDVPSEMNG